MKQQIKRLYDEAAQLHSQAKAILAEFAGKEMPQEKSAQVDQLLDQVEAKTAEAKRLERALEQESFLNDPAGRRSFFQEPPQGPAAKVLWNGRELDAEEVEELKACGPFRGFVSAMALDYTKALRAYHRKGKNGLTPDEVKALAAGEAPAGGYLVQDTYLNQLIVKAREMSAMRRISNVLPPVPSGSVIAPAEDGMFTDATWTTELGTGSEDTQKPFGTRRLQPHPLAKRVKVSNTFLRTPTFDAEAYVRDRLAYKFGVTGENAFVNGDGVSKPLGLLNTSGLVSYTSAVALTVSGDDIINWIYRLPAAYRGQARILCNVAFIRKVRLLKDGLSQYLWQPGLQAGSPSTILDTPYELSDRVDDALDANDAWEANKYPAIIGDFSYYWIVDALGMSVQRLNELYAETNQTGFIGRMESDGMCVQAEAFIALKVHA